MSDSGGTGLRLREILRRKYRSRGNNFPKRLAIRLSMKIEERERMYQLCALIEKETDHHRFLQLIRQLNDLLERSQGVDHEASTPEG